MDQRHWFDVDGVVREVGTDQFEAAQIGKPLAGRRKVAGVEVDSDDARGDRAVQVLQAVSARDAEHGHRPRPQPRQRLAEQIGERSQLVDRRRPHVPLVIVERQDQPRVHCRDRSSGLVELAGGNCRAHLPVSYRVTYSMRHTPHNRSCLNRLNPSKICGSNSGAACLVVATLAQLRVEHYGYTLRKALADHGLASTRTPSTRCCGGSSRRGCSVSEWREENKRNKRFYRLSPEGERTLALLLDEWRGINAALDRILRPAGFLEGPARLAPLVP